jgi:hypothetical protein
MAVNDPVGNEGSGVEYETGDRCPLSDTLN